MVFSYSSTLNLNPYAFSNTKIFQIFRNTENIEKIILRLLNYVRLLKYKSQGF
ncbi:hypothetical protein H1P_130031 [Hyella patelloides LEGE 07179]|uniref:Uncharacterized protein n=1 Tax=Hyella patelloides LEGE 07179 TaxID=945734 RepID=A0A563VKS0_9CYAN|nr:hypothetical protein H1P_130031 [Hyella patelloides LEGE 07179]